MYFLLFINNFTVRNKFDLNRIHFLFRLRALLLFNFLFNCTLKLNCMWLTYCFAIYKVIQIIIGINTCRRKVVLWILLFYEWTFLISVLSLFSSLRERWGNSLVNWRALIHGNILKSCILIICVYILSLNSYEICGKWLFFYFLVWRTLWLRYLFNGVELIIIFILIGLKLRPIQLF